MKSAFTYCKWAWLIYCCLFTFNVLSLNLSFSTTLSNNFLSFNYPSAALAISKLLTGVVHIAGMVMVYAQYDRLSATIKQMISTYASLVAIFFISWFSLSQLNLKTDHLYIMLFQHGIPLLLGGLLVYTLYNCREANVFAHTDEQILDSKFM